MICIFRERNDCQRRRDMDMDDPTRRVLMLFRQMNAESLDLHTLFEAGGNDPRAREEVVDIVTQLVRSGLLEEHGSDFYTLTQKGRDALARS
jgi:hypothetical protein